MIAVQELLEAEKQNGNGNEVTCNDRKDASAGVAPVPTKAGGQRCRRLVIRRPCSRLTGLAIVASGILLVDGQEL